MSLLVYSDWTWMFCHCKFALTWIWLRHNEIGHLLVSEVNLHILIRVNQSLLMLHIWQILDIRAKELMIINKMSIVVHASWQTLTMIESKLMVPLLNRWVFILICLVLTVKWTQFTCCVVCDFGDLVWNLIYLRIFEILRLFIIFTSWFSGSYFSTFPRPIRFRCFLRLLIGLLNRILKANLYDTLSRHFSISTTLAKIGDGKISFTLN